MSPATAIPIWADAEQLHKVFANLLSNAMRYTPTGGRVEMAVTSVAPPEGFVADYDELSEEVDNELEAVQFTITDVGSDWIPTPAKHVVRHRGRREVVLSLVGVRLSEELARARGVNREGHPLGPDGRPLPEPGFDPRAPREVEIAGWIEPSTVDAAWTFKLRVDETSEVSLAITRGRGLLVRLLASGELAPGEHAFLWDGLDRDGEALKPGRYFVTLVVGDLVDSVPLVEQ